MCCLAFQTRDPRLGKGERRLGLAMFLALPLDLQKGLAKLIPVHGSWKDVRTLLTLPVKGAEGAEEGDAEQKDPKDSSLGALDETLSQELVSIFADALRKDIRTVSGSEQQGAAGDGGKDEENDDFVHVDKP